MASTSQKITAHVGNTATDLYTFPTSGPTRARCFTLTFCNTTAADITLDVWVRNSGDTDSFYLCDDIVVPAKGQYQWSGAIVLSSNPEKVRAQASAVGVDVLGEVLENA